MDKVIAYTDGSATTKYPYLGGFGVYIKHSGQSIRFRKGYSCTKTGRMELMAALYCLRAIRDKSMRVLVYSDSQYVCNTCNEWIDRWESQLWLDKKNVDLLKQLIVELRVFRHRPEFRHIKGHQEVTNKHTHGNNIADELASYKTQSSYEVDLPLDDLTTFEREDFTEVDGKLYYQRETVS